MILYFSGTGNSEYVAKRLGEAVKDNVQSLFLKIRNSEHSPVESAEPFVIVSPTYAWRIPKILEDWLDSVTLSGNKKIYFVMTCGDNIGNAEAYCKRLCSKKGMSFMGCFPVIMPENYIAMFNTPTVEEAKRIIGNAEAKIDEAAEYICAQKPFPAKKITLADRLSSSIVNATFYPLFVSAKKFRVTDKCVSCKKCESVCPLGNITLKDGCPVWGNRCTHCMACISRCPKAAIEYGKHSVGLPRYVFPK